MPTVCNMYADRRICFIWIQLLCLVLVKFIEIIPTRCDSTVFVSTMYVDLCSLVLMGLFHAIFLASGVCEIMKRVWLHTAYCLSTVACVVFFF